MDNLDFKDFSTLDGSKSFKAGSSGAEQSMSGNLLDSSSSMGTQKEPTANKPHFMSLEYYQRFFDIDEDMVITRILNSAFPRRNGNFIADFVQPNPDLWGPFWISTTLVFSIAIVSNFAGFLNSYGTGQQYISDFNYVTGATSLVFGYVLLLPSLIYTFLWYHRPASLHYSFFDLLCAYGYSLSLFIPASILCPILPFNSIRWSLAITAALFSGVVLVISLWSTLKEDPNRMGAFASILAIFMAHILFAICLKKFFFDIDGFPAPAPALPSVIPSTNVPPTAGPTTNSTSV